MVQIIFRILLIPLGIALSAAGWAAASMTPEDALRERIGMLHAGGPDTLAAAADLEQFYRLHNFSPVWNSQERLERLAVAISGLETDGLNPSSYGLGELRRFTQDAPQDTEELACRDLAATHAYLLALQHLTNGVTQQDQVEPVWRHGGADRSPSRDFVIARAAAGIRDSVAEFERVRPDSALYRGLGKAYAALREAAPIEEPPEVPPGPSLREGDRDARVPLLRRRLEHAGYTVSPASDTDLYDALLSATVSGFQREHQLEVDGIAGRATLAALNIPAQRRMDAMRVNLERLRWLSREFDPQLVLVDIAGAKVSYFREGRIVWQARTQVGRASRPTPELKSEITHFTFNPTWTVPPTIFRNDKLPEIRRNIEYLAQNRFRVLDRDGNDLSPYEVNWERPGAIMLRQDAGPDNALGQVAIRFPNPFFVYLHDTPSQRLFARDQRTFSSGCVRVEQARNLVDLLIADGSGITPERVETLFSDGKTRQVNLSRPIPILMAYWTADITDDGRVILRQDIYQRDAPILEALKLAEHRATTALPPRCEPSAAIRQRESQ